MQKSSCLRIGPRHGASVQSISINYQTLSWKQELSYLGFILFGGKSFKINLQKIKQNIIVH